MRWLGGPQLAPCLPFKTRFTHPDAAAEAWSPQASCVWNSASKLTSDGRDSLPGKSRRAISPKQNL